jgi:hypothetical protein
VQLYAMGVFEPAIFIGMTKEEISGPRLLSEIAEQRPGPRGNGRQRSPECRHQNGDRIAQPIRSRLRAEEGEQ